MALKQLKPPPGSSDPDLIFVHGILSDTARCWSHNAQVNWPGIVASDRQFPKCGVRTYEYLSTKTDTRLSVSEIAEDLWQSLRNAGLVKPGWLPVFVCHSMGGIVVRKMMVTRRQELADAGVTVAGLFLVASPSAGSRWARWLHPIIRAWGHRQGVVLSDAEDNQWLQDLRIEFRNLGATGPVRIFGQELVEHRPLKLKWLPWMPPIVRRIEATHYFANPLTIQGSDHSTIAKPHSTEAQQHQTLRTFVADLLRKAYAGNSAFPAGTTFAQAMFATASSFGLHIDLSGLRQTESDVATTGNQYVSGMGPANELEAVAAAFPTGSVRPFRVTIHGNRASLTFQTEDRR